ncbi:glycoprotein precursor [Mammarenavirus oliverosense]|uniref:Pre-glycoprotein polyprotein GP complex n=1 Tax=Oliveros mammarenavirus (isolate Mouse/Argentina/RIID 3229/1990) TaxID=3052322 RepID=GLYC_OLVVA|nr:glycoprotein precursor [Mammarenavirus oliverosense]Q84168.1 RecName: Full=Pre-glycoprotein polyprotein GP complex; Short=Pre-GP-C; Contains: RecName: Full=Stable signal peptide; Short=SSP; Contains: RecName: Full=Glycoprotein G1; Short=GP1; Contains: RecName: Full=Glycoprotein G2; Short=GP2 [Mammarenavirus oliverosense]AAC54654.1 glycoprotein precursor [Mammarenavirus oliverosense]
MGQVIGFFQSLPNIINEALNIALICVALIAILKGIVNIWKSGLIQLFIFLILAGRSCSHTFQIGRNHEFQSITLNFTQFLGYAPSSCSVNNTHHYFRGPGNVSWGIELTLTNNSVINASNSLKVFTNIHHNITNCVQNIDEQDHLMKWLIETMHLQIMKPGKRLPPILCEKDKGLLIEYNLTNIASREEKHSEYWSQLLYGLSKLLGSSKSLWFDYCQRADCMMQEHSSHLKCNYSECSGHTTFKYLILQNTTWENHCEFNHLNTIHLLMSSTGQSFITRRLQAFLTWTLSDATGNDLPGGYCLEQWAIVWAGIKCFGNTAVAKCNQNHDSEFCDMLRLFDYNRNAIKSLNDQSQSRLNLLTNTINSLISDNLLMKNKLAEIMNIPYCNYTKFWYINDTRTGRHTLPQCWLISNGSYLNETKFRTQWLSESNALYTEMLTEDYDKRQGSTPLSLVDLCFWSTLFYVTTLFAHLVGFPTHRHILDGPCPKPHRLTKKGICSCGHFGIPGKPVRWVKRSR